MSTMKLRPYERDWLKRIRQCEAKRILVVGPTGAGKTVIAVQLMRAKGMRTLFVVHRRELAGQAFQRLVEHGVNPKQIGAIMAIGRLECGDHLPSTSPSWRSASASRKRRGTSR